MSSPNLRDALLSALNSLPGKRTFHIHVLSTAPYKHSSLYPYAIPRPRVVAHDILVLISEQAPDDDDAPRVFVSALEAALYLFPSTSCATLYISKVDSTGQGARPSPTSALVRAFVAWHAANVRSQTLWVNLFARAQAQYLFPNSAEHPEKRPLSDVQLCAWWRRVLGSVPGATRRFYVLPGYAELDAAQALGGADPDWTYGHPYAQEDIPLPCPPPANEVHNIGHIIPSFEDDPKNRFMDELAFTDAVVESPARKRPRLERLVDAERERDREREKQKEREREEGEKEKKAKGELGRITPAEFWERMSFRQECVAGAVTGFFVLGFKRDTPSSASASTSADAAPRPPPLQPQPGQVPRAMNKRILKTLMTGVEFSTTERARKGTEIVESAIRGLCEGLSSASAPASTSGPTSSAPRPHIDASGKLLPASPAPASGADPETPRTPPRRPHALPPSTDDVSPNPFDEPEATLETFRAHIYGAVEVRNERPPAARAPEAVVAPKVNVLAVRKKKKPAAAAAAAA